MTRSTPFSGVAIVGALVAITLFATAAVMFVTGDGATEKLGLLFALLGTVIAGLIATLRADQAASQTNGKLDARIETAVLNAMAQRRTTDTVVVPAVPIAPANIEQEPPAA